MDLLHGQPFEQRPKWMQLLDAARERADRANDARGEVGIPAGFSPMPSGHKSGDVITTVRDAGEETFRFRDYFHGQNREISSA